VRTIRAVCLGAIVAALWISVAAAEAVLRQFEDDATGAVPAGFTFAAARQQSPGQWTVRADGANHYLAHAADSSAAQGFSLALLDPVHTDDVRVSVRLKLTGGERVGGVVWRYQDPENFYAVSLDLARQEVAVYRVVRGNRIRLEDEDDLELDVDAWHVVRVEHDGGRIRVALGGIGVIRTQDRTPSISGRAGVWSGGASTTWFDDLRTEDVPRQQRSDDEPRRRR